MRLITLIVLTLTLGFGIFAADAPAAKPQPPVQQAAPPAAAPAQPEVITLKDTSSLRFEVLRQRGAVLDKELENLQLKQAQWRGDYFQMVEEACVDAGQPRGTCVFDLQTNTLYKRPPAPAPAPAKSKVAADPPVNTSKK